jgi:hypothetical protein
LKPKRGKKSLAFLFEEINALKRQLKPERLQTVTRGRLNPSSLLKFMSNLTTNGYEGEEYLVTSSKLFSSSKTKLAKSSHPTTESFLSLIVNNEEHLLRALAVLYVERTIAIYDLF